jgi:ATP-dependent Clp protease ATP-binding subunit ClpA
MSRKHEAFPLDDRMAAAFTDGATPDTVAALIQEAEAAARVAGDAAEQAVSRLRERLTQVQAAEEDDRRRAAYEEASAERDELAAELARVYPPLAAQLADLLGRLRASDDRIEYMNAHALPRGCRPLLVAELVARGFDGFVRDSVEIPRIARRVRLPAFECDIHAPYAWPQSSSVDAGSLMFRAMCELGSRSA